MNKRSRDIWRRIRNSLGGFLLDHGFEPAKNKMRYFRALSTGAVHVIAFSLSPGGRLDVDLLVYAPELLVGAGGKQDIEGDLGIYVGESLGPERLGGRFYQESLESPEDADRVLGKIRIALQDMGIPYLNSFNNREAFWNACPEEIRKSWLEQP